MSAVERTKQKVKQRLQEKLDNLEVLEHGLCSLVHNYVSQVSTVMLFSQASKNPLAPTGEVIFSVSIDINYYEQKFTKETFKHLPSNFTLICVVFR